MKTLFPILFISLFIFSCDDDSNPMESEYPEYDLICQDGNVGLWGECYNIEETTHLDLSISGLTGEIPLEIVQLTNLTHLYLYNNQLTGYIPSGICNSNYVSIENNQLCLPYPECISQSDIDSQDTSNCP